MQAVETALPPSHHPLVEVEVRVVDMGAVLGGESWRVRKVLCTSTGHEVADGLANERKRVSDDHGGAEPELVRRHQDLP